jgi:phosphatidate cytidylyltransferase
VSEGLRKRILTAVPLGVALLVILLALPPVFTVVTVTVVMLAGAWEWSGFLKLSRPALRAAYVGITALLIWGTWRLAAGDAGRDALILAAVIWWCVALLWVALAPQRASTITAALAGVLALVPAWLALVCMRLGVNGAQWVVFTLILVFAADIGAYFGGRHFGRVKLAPQVSPGKTWEGVLGGIVLSGAWALGGSRWFHIPWLSFVPLCASAVAFSIVGDLTESMLKRFAGLKDSGSLLPGHGGMMDRIDSITAAAPVLFFGLTSMGVVP